LAAGRVLGYGGLPCGFPARPATLDSCGGNYYIKGVRRTATMTHRTAKFRLGQVVKHRMFPFRGVIFDVDPEFSNTEEWYEAIPEDIRPAKDQPFYHLLAENAEAYYVAYVSEQNLVSDDSGDPIEHPQVGEVFDELRDGAYVGLKTDLIH
jgi:heat shock protein HspQ